MMRVESYSYFFGGTMPFRHRKDIMSHKQKVSQNTLHFITELYNRQALHDNDKISNDIIFHAYEAHNNHLRQLPFGSEEYRRLMQNELSEAAFLHAQNRHHFYSKSHQQNTKVDLIDLIEYIVDIKSSIERDDILSDAEVLNQLKKAVLPIVEKLSISSIVEHTIDHIFQKEGNEND